MGGCTVPVRGVVVVSAEICDERRHELVGEAGEQRVQSVDPGGARVGAAKRVRDLADTRDVGLREARVHGDGDVALGEARREACVSKKSTGREKGTGGLRRRSARDGNLWLKFVTGDGA